MLPIEVVGWLLSAILAISFIVSIIIVAFSKEPELIHYENNDEEFLQINKRGIQRKN